MSDKMKKVLVGLPMFSFTEPEFEEALPGAIQTDKASVSVCRLHGTNTPNARNILVKEALKRDMTHIFFMDVDMVHPTGSLDRLLSYNVDIVGGYYHCTSGEYPVRAFKKDKKEDKWLHFIEKGSELVEVDGIGTGCLLISMSVFEAVRFPWFNYTQVNGGEQLSTEDIYFCNKAKNSGYKVYCDPSIRCGHVGKFIVFPDDKQDRVKLIPTR